MEQLDIKEKYLLRLCANTAPQKAIETTRSRASRRRGKKNVKSKVPTIAKELQEL